VWIRLDQPAVSEARQPFAGTYLLSERQVQFMAGYSARVTSGELPNGHAVSCALLTPGEGPRALPPSLSRQPFSPAGLQPGPQPNDAWLFTTLPASDYRNELPSEHAFHAVLHPDRKQEFGRRPFAVLRNERLETRYPGVDTSVAVRVCFSETIAAFSTAIEETALIAAGLREGEVCWLTPAGRRRRIRLEPFAYRHLICRIAAATTLDQDKPICRLPEPVFDVLGLSHGLPVVVERPATSSAGANRWLLRALPDRQAVDPLPLRGGAPDFLDETGNVDLPNIRLDGIRQREMGVSRGSSVYVRPGTLTYLQQELSPVAWLLVGGIVASVAQNELYVAALLSALLLVGAVLIALRDIRR